MLRVSHDHYVVYEKVIPFRNIPVFSSTGKCISQILELSFISDAQRFQPGYITK